MEKTHHRFRVLSSALEQALPGLCFVWSGWVITIYFNESIWGFLGILVALWGGFKILLFLIITGLGVLYRLFQPEVFADIKIRRHLSRILLRIENDKRAGNIERSIDRIHGLMKIYPFNTDLKKLAANHYLSLGDYVMAGRYLYLRDNLDTPCEKQAVAYFEKSLGRAPQHILRTITKGMDPQHFDKELSKKLRPLYNAIFRENECRGRLYAKLSRDYQFFDFSFLKRAWIRSHTYLIENACLILILISIIAFGWRIPMEKSTLINIIALICSVGVAAYFVLRERTRELKTKPRKIQLSKAEQKRLESYQKKYIHIPETDDLPLLETDGFELVDISLIACKIVLRFDLPELSEKRRLLTDDLVKIGFNIDEDDSAERMWVKITKVLGNDFFEGILDNTPHTTDHLAAGHKIKFHANHIRSICNK